MGAEALIVHPGHAEDGIDEGVKRWARTLEMLETEVPVYLENTAGGDNAVARRADALAKLWEAVAGARTTASPLGFCFDTCHAHAAGEDLSDVVERMRAITGRDRPRPRQRLARPARHRRRPPRQPRRRADGPRRHPPA